MTSIDRVSLNGDVIAYIYNLKDGHRYFTRRTAVALDLQQKTALEAFLKRADFYRHLSSGDIDRLVNQSLIPSYTPIESPRAAAHVSGLSITHCL